MIQNAIDYRVNWDKCKGFYIGKTDDFERRYSEHKSEGYHLMWELAKGSSAQISDWEDKLLKLYKGHPKLINKNAGSAGDEDATILYFAYKLNDFHLNELHDDTEPIAENFPIDLNKCNK